MASGRRADAAAAQGWVSTDGPTWTALDKPPGLDDYVEGMWVVPDCVIYAGQQSFSFGTPTVAPVSG